MPWGVSSTAHLRLLLALMIMVDAMTFLLVVQIKRLVPDRGCLNWADCARTVVASGRTGVSVIAVIPLRARKGLDRPKRKF
jgi:hypothetical protein